MTSKMLWTGDTVQFTLKLMVNLAPILELQDLKKLSWCN